VTLTLNSVGNAIWKDSQIAADKIREYIFLNGATDHTMSVTDGHNTMVIGPLNSVTGGVISATHRIMFATNNGATNQQATCPAGCFVSPSYSSSTGATSTAGVAGLDADGFDRVGKLTANAIAQSCLAGEINYLCDGNAAAAPTR
jgi:hypothetical protein